MWEFATEESIAWSIVSPKWGSSQSKWNCSCTREQQVASREYCQRLSTSASTDEHNKNEPEKLPRTATKIETETQLEIEIKIGIEIMQMKLCACARAKLRGMRHRSDCGQWRERRGLGAWLGGCCRRCLVGACVRSGRCRWLIDKNAAQNTRISRGVCCHGNCYQLEYPKMDKRHLVRPVILASLAIEGKQLMNYFVYCFLSFSI